MKMMKKILSLFLALLLLLAALTSCIRFPLYQNDADDNGGTEEEPNTEETLYEEFEGQPYLIKYLGTSVTDIRINPYYTEDFELIIPEFSPEGNRVTTISMKAYDQGDHFYFYPMPQVLTEADFDEWQAGVNAKLESGELTSHEFSLLNILYSRISYEEEPSEERRAQILEKYPYAKSMSFYALPDITPEWLDVYGSAFSHLDYTVQDLIEDEANFRSAVEQCTLEDKESVLKKLPFIADRLSTHIVGIQIPQSVQRLGKYVFAGCARVESITLPSRVTSIPDHAFMGCTNLRTLEISNGVKTIGDYAFAGCENLRLMELPDELTSIGERAFYACSSLMLTTIPNSVTRIGRYAFMNTHLIRAEAPEYQLAYFDGWLMYADSGMLSASVRNGCVGIADEVFLDCQYLRSVTLPEGLETIGASAFQNCERLKNITIPSSVKRIGEHAFEGCIRLFDVVNLSRDITLSRGSSGHGYLGYYALDIRTSPNVPSKFRTDENGYTFYENGDECYLISCISSKIKLELPESCNGKPYAIYAYAFSHCTNLRRVTIPSGVTGIGEAAFKGRDILDGITIPEGVTRIEMEAFRGCYGLKYVVIPSTVTNIGASAFKGISYQCIIYYNGTEANWDRISVDESVSKHVYFYSKIQPTDNGHYWHFVNGVPTVWNP